MAPEAEGGRGGAASVQQEEEQGAAAVRDTAAADADYTAAQLTPTLLLTGLAQPAARSRRPGRPCQPARPAGCAPVARRHWAPPWWPPRWRGGSAARRRQADAAEEAEHRHGCATARAAAATWASASKRSRGTQARQESHLGRAQSLSIRGGGSHRPKYEKQKRRRVKWGETCLLTQCSNFKRTTKYNNLIDSQRQPNTTCILDKCV